MLKLWILVTHGTVDETMPQRRRKGCTLTFCQRCLTKDCPHNDEIYCADCRVIVVEGAQVEDLPDWGEVMGDERDHRQFGCGPEEIDSDGDIPGHD